MPRKTPDPDRPMRRCCFPDAIGSRLAGCARAVKSTKQYRRTVKCTNSRAHGVCVAWLDCVRRASRFTLGTHQSPSALPRRAAIRLQKGGLLGMADVMDAHERVERVPDVSALLQRALVRYGSFDRVPLQPVIQRVNDVDNDEP